MDDDTAPIQRIDPAAREIKLRQAIERACNGRFRYIQFGRESANRMGAFLEIAGQENTQLPS